MFISQAFAQAAPTGVPGMDWISLFPLILMFGILYFLIIRPQSKRAKEHKAIIEGLQKGDEVVTAAGIVGRVTKVGKVGDPDEHYVTLEVAPNVEIRVQKPAVTTPLPKGTLKAL